MKEKFILVLFAVLFLNVVNADLISENSVLTRNCKTIVSVDMEPSVIYLNETLKIFGRVDVLDFPFLPTNSFLENENITSISEVEFYIDNKLIGTNFTDRDGVFLYSYKIPINFSTGTHYLKAVSRVNGCQEGFVIKKFTVIGLNVPEVPKEDYCILEIYVTDQNNNPLVANIYINDTLVSNDSYTLQKIMPGIYIITANKTGYLDSKTYINCSSGDRIKIELKLFLIKVCDPGEIKNRSCVNDTSIYYEKCKDDGLGWNIIIENCPIDSSCFSGYCIKKSVRGSYSYSTFCMARYLDEYRCVENKLQRKYLLQNCSITWMDWEMCELGCLNNYCVNLSNITVSEIYVETYSNLSVAAYIQIKNEGIFGEYIYFSPYICTHNKYCISMDCTIKESRAYIPNNATLVIKCIKNYLEPGLYNVRFDYYFLNNSYTSYSEMFYVEGNGKCVERFLDEFECDDNWKLQLYKYSNCSTKWIYLEKCAYGCLGGECMSETNRTCIECEKESLKINFPTGYAIIVENLAIILLFLISIFIIFFHFYLIRRKIKKPLEI
ncbi:MAG: hypothetical protein QXX30_01065 [Candidatus Aenigmatarchaeota archaeon]